jgi:perosamine synthetase
MNYSTKNKIKIPLSSPDISGNDKSAVLGVLSTPYLSLGPKVKEFEKRMASYIGIKYAAAVNSATSGLHLIIRALGIKDGDEVITTPFSFIASSNCILYERAKPVFVDIDPLTLNINPSRIEKAITKKTKAILAVDVFGYPAEWNRLREVSSKHKLRLIEDSAEALGSEYKGKKCGTFADAAVLSFYPNKQMTTGEGGVIVADDKKIIDLCRSMANQGRRIKGSSWLEHVCLGYNYRLSDINAALGIAQLSRIKEIMRKRAKVARMYSERLKLVPDIILPYKGHQAKISWFVYVIRLSDAYSINDRDNIIRKMSKKGIQCSNYFKAIHLQPLYKKIFGYKKGSFPVCEAVSDRTIALPFYNNLKEKEIKFVVDNFKEALLYVKKNN